jgi:aspartate/methionine/tyrosine aminotransferase
MFQAPNYKITKENVFLTAGGSLALWSAIMMLANEGDNFVFPSPSFPLSCVISAAVGI